MESRLLLTADVTINDLAVTVTDGANVGLFDVSYQGRSLITDSNVVHVYRSATATQGVVYPEYVRVFDETEGSYLVLNKNIRQETMATWDSNSNTLTQTFKIYSNPEVEPTELVVGNQYLVGQVVVATTVEANPSGQGGGARLSFNVTTTQDTNSAVTITGTLLTVDGFDYGAQGEPGATSMLPSEVWYNAEAKRWTTLNPIWPVVLGSKLKVGTTETGIVAVADDEVRTQHSTDEDAPFGGDKPRFINIENRVTTDGIVTLQAGSFWESPFPGNNGFYGGEGAFGGKRLGPDQSDTVEFSIRFAPAGTSLEQLASDVYANFASYWAPEHVSDDRRPMLATFVAQHQNFFDEELNPNAYKVPSWPAGAMYPYRPKPETMDQEDWEDATNLWGRTLATYLIGRAQGTVASLQSIGGQGAVVWDLEGKRYQFDANGNWPTVYIGDPTQAHAIAPELGWIDPDENANPEGLTIAERYFETFRLASMSCGVTIRAQDLVQTGPDDYDQRDVDVLNDLVEILAEKIEYAVENWGCTLFYVDSDRVLMDPYVYKRVQDLVGSDVVIMPENQNAGAYATTAPYDQLVDSLPMGAPDIVRKLYPDAFGVFSVLRHTAEQTPLSNNPAHFVYQKVTDAVSRGNVVM